MTILFLFELRRGTHSIYRTVVDGDKRGETVKDDDDIIL